MDDFIRIFTIIILSWPATYIVDFILDISVKEKAIPDDTSEEVWKILKQPLGDSGGKWLGFFERILFSLTFWQVAYPIIIAWLALKLGSKWQVWTAIIDLKNNEDEAPKFKTRRVLASYLHQRFLIGVITNILIAWLIYFSSNVSVEIYLNCYASKVI